MGRFKKIIGFFRALYYMRRTFKRVWDKISQIEKVMTDLGYSVDKANEYIRREQDEKKQKEKRKKLLSRIKTLKYGDIIDVVHEGGHKETVGFSHLLNKRKLCIYRKSMDSSRTFIALEHIKEVNVSRLKDLIKKDEN